MAILENDVEKNIFYDFWKQVQDYLFSQNRFVQLITFKPIEIYNEKLEIEVDTAKIQLHINSHLENLVKLGVDRTLSLFTFNRTSNKKIFQYDFNVVISAYMSYAEVSKFFNFHFSNQTFPLDEMPETDTKIFDDNNKKETNKYNITLDKFDFYNEREQLATNLTFSVDAKWNFIKQKAKGKLKAVADIEYQAENYLIKTNNLEYGLQSKNLILYGIDKFYHDKIIEQLSVLLQYTFEVELLKLKEDAQHQINTLEEQNGWISGTVKDLKLDQIFIKDDGIHATLLANGFVDLI